MTEEEKDKKIEELENQLLEKERELYGALKTISAMSQKIDFLNHHKLYIVKKNKILAEEKRALLIEVQGLKRVKIQN